MPAHGTLAITARGDGTRWYGRISISVAIARKACLKEGTRVSARCVDGEIVIKADDYGRIKFPAAKGKADPKHAFEAATSTLGLRHVKLCQAATQTQADIGEVRLKVPEDCLSADPPKKPGRRKDETRKPAPVVLDPAAPKLYGAAGAIVTEAGRSGKVVRPMTLADIVERISEMGQDIKVLGPRFFKLNGKSVTMPDLLDEVNRLCGSTEHDRIALIVD